FVQRRHGIGIQVTDRSHEVAAHSISLMLQRGRSDVADLLEVRLGLECQSATLAALRATKSDLQVLAESIETMANQSSTLDEYVDADLGFHLHLAEATHNAVLVALINAIRDLLHQSIRATYDVDGRTERRLDAHRLVLEAVQRRDPHAAEAAMREHLHYTELMLRELGLIPAGHAPLVR
ncbi:MAG TPA: FCD domain-containing protein, partial [Chloroflexota bacterium]|nr:FCD domain-containing protein [Chloroflexota bacterium]